MALPIWPSRIFGPCVTTADVAHAHRRAVLRLEDRGSDIVDVAHQAHRAHVDLLQPGLDEAAAGVDVVVRRAAAPPGRCSARRRPACRDRPAPGTRAWCRRSSTTSTTFGTDLNCFSSTQSSQRLQLHQVVLRIGAAAACRSRSDRPGCSRRRSAAAGPAGRFTCESLSSTFCRFQSLFDSSSKISIRLESPNSDVERRCVQVRQSRSSRSRWES